MHGIEAEQLRGALTVDRKVGADHDRRAGRADIDAAIGAMEAVEIARQRRHPREPEVGQRHRVGVLSEAVARQDRIGMVASQLDEHAPQAVHGAHEGEELLALQGVDPYRAQVAGTARQMEAAANVLAEQADQVLLAGVQAAAGPQARLHDPFRFHLPESAQSGYARWKRKQTFFDEHDGMRLVESVDRREKRLHVAAINLAELRQHLLAQADPGVAIAPVVGRFLLQHDVYPPLVILDALDIGCSERMPSSIPIASRMLSLRCALRLTAIVSSAC